MSRAWWIRIFIIVGILLWGGYSLTPTFLEDSAQNRLAAQADQADSAAKSKKIEEDDRLPEAKELPLWLREKILADLRDCRGSCKEHATAPAENAWVDAYILGDGKTAQNRCAQKSLTVSETEGCAVEGLKACTETCTSDTSGGRGEKECAEGCLALNNELFDAPDWAVQYYAAAVNGAFNSCVGEKAAGYMETESCVGQKASACVSACRLAREEELPFWAQATMVLYPSARLSLGLDLQGGIDMDLEVEVDEAVHSSVQRDISPVLEFSEIQGIGLETVRRATGEDTLLIAPKEGTTLGDVRGFMSNRFADYEYVNTRTEFGTEFFAFALLETSAEEIGVRAIEQALETLRSRIDETGVKEPSIVLKGGNRINVQLPGIDDVQQAISAIGTAAVLEFMLVDEEVMKQGRDLERSLFDAEKEMEPGDFLDDSVLSDHLVRTAQIPPTTRLMWEYKALPEGGKERADYYVVKDEIMLTGDDINDASVSINQFNEPYVAMEFKPRGASIFAEVTGANVNRRFAIVLDRQVRSAPNIREKIAGGRASIEMGVGDYNLAMQEASVLSLVLRTGALPAPVTIGKVRTVGASLGADAIAAGQRATIVGFGLVLVFMLIYYKKAGIVSVAALVSNVLLVFALLATAGATLTLPGIAGIALTIGMAVDCNIIIYERIREELHTGKNARSAVGTGFDKALLAVLDANITTFIAGVVLYTYGTGPIKGFAVTLMIGIITTLFTGIFLSRTLMDLLTRKASARLSI
jgi:protein-export membrane protein SecD